MMFGLILSATLLSLPLMAWPIYLHLLKPKQRIQIVPSLKLFTLLHKKTRTRRIEDILLLIARLLVFLFLILLVGRPYCRTNKRLSFPDLVEKTGTWAHPMIGIVLDDSVCAMNSKNGKTRVDECRAWLLKQLAALPDDLVCAVVTTGISSEPIFLPKDQALRIIKQLPPMPLKGDACRALKQIETIISGRKGLMLVMASRDQMLWPRLKSSADLATPGAIFFFDTTDHQADAFIRSVTMISHHGSNSEWSCRLDGIMERTTDKKLIVRDETGHEVNFLVIARSRLSDTINIELTSEGKGMCYEAALEESFAHPWLNFYFSTDPAWERDNRVIIFREDTDPARLADDVLTAAIRAIHPQAQVVHVGDTASIVQSELEAATILTVGNIPFSPEWRTWLDSQADKGARILCVPCISAQNPAPAWLSRNTPNFLPTWERDSSVLNDGDFPLQLDQTALLKATGYTATNMFNAFQESASPVLCKAVFNSPTQVLLKTRQNHSILTTCAFGDKTRIFALGFPLTLRDGSFVFHPGFPVLIKSLLFPDAATARPHVEPVVGDTVNLSEWFGQDAMDKTLIFPDGSKQEVRSSADNPQWMTLSASGFYRLETSEQQITRVVNYPRPPELLVFERAEWQNAHPNTKIKWLDSSSHLLAEDFSIMTPSGKTSFEHQYDLSGIAASLLILFFAAECLLLWLRWRARNEGT